MLSFSIKWTLAAALGAASISTSLAQGSWQPLAHQPPWAPSTMLLLTDGSILTQRHYPNGDQWAKLVPDINGSYVNGNWVTVDSTNWTRLYYACSVLADGRVIVAGGEYSNAGSQTNKVEVYDPAANLWTEIAGPGWSNIGDAPGCVVADGRFYLASIFDNRTSFWNPSTAQWTPGPNKLDPQGTEENWAVLPDGSIIAPECRNFPATERWVPSTNTWISAGNTVVNLVLPGSLEMGACLAMYDGRCIAIGGTPHIGFYQFPAIPTGTGTWFAGPDFPLINGRMIGAEDAPACILPNGHVLITVGPVTAQGGTFESPTYFFEYDGFNLNRITDPPNNSDVPYNGRLMITPTGQALYAHNGVIYVYTPVGSPDPVWKPVVTASPATVAPGSSYLIQGQQFNGLSEACGYGDEGQPATNYPIIRIRNISTGHVFYCRTFNHSTMAIATGTATVSTNFKVPAGIEVGDGELTVIANGIPSTPVPIIVQGTIDLLPDSFTVVVGSLMGGGLPELGNSDNGYLRVMFSATVDRLTPPVQLAVKTHSAIRHPLTIQFKVESAVSLASAIQTLFLWNYLTNGWEQIDSRGITNADGTVTVSPGGNLSRFVKQTDGEIQANLTMIAQDPFAVARWNGRFDLVTWKLTD